MKKTCLFVCKLLLAVLLIGADLLVMTSMVSAQTMIDDEGMIIEEEGEAETIAEEGELSIMPVVSGEIELDGESTESGQLGGLADVGGTVNENWEELQSDYEARIARLDNELNLLKASNQTEWYQDPMFFYILAGATGVFFILTLVLLIQNSGLRGKVRRAQDNVGFNSQVGAAQSSLVNDEKIAGLQQVAAGGSAGGLGVGIGEVAKVEDKKPELTAMGTGMGLGGSGVVGGGIGMTGGTESNGVAAGGEIGVEKTDLASNGSVGGLGGVAMSGLGVVGEVKSAEGGLGVTEAVVSSEVGATSGDGQVVGATVGQSAPAGLGASSGSGLNSLTTEMPSAMSNSNPMMSNQSGLASNSVPSLGSSLGGVTPSVGGSASVIPPTVAAGVGGQSIPSMPSVSSAPVVPMPASNPEQPIVSSAVRSVVANNSEPTAS